MSGAPWWAILASTALGGLLAVAGSLWSSARDRGRSRREEWFRRVQWADTLTSSEDPQRRATGLRLLQMLARPDLRHDDDAADAAFIDALNRPAVLDEYESADAMDELTFAEDTEPTTEEQP